MQSVIGSWKREVLRTKRAKFCDDFGTDPIGPEGDCSLCLPAVDVLREGTGEPGREDVVLAATRFKSDNLRHADKDY